VQSAVKLAEIVKGEMKWKQQRKNRIAEFQWKAG
jgi:hypothetical protein